MRRILAALLFLLPFNALADTEIPLSADLHPVRLAATADGTLWYAAYREGQLVTERVEVGRVLPNGVVEKVALPHFYINDLQAALVPLPDGGVAVAGATSTIVKVDGRMQVTQISSQNGIRTIYDMTYGADGNLWFVGEDTADAPVVGRLTPGGAIARFPLPGGSFAIASAPDGNLYVANYSGIHRVTASGEMTLASACNCQSRWLEVASDGTVWSANGRLLPNGSFIADSVDDVLDGVEGADGNMWLAVRRTNALHVHSSDGDITRVVPFAHANIRPLAVASSGDVIWYGVRGAIRGFDLKTQIDLRLVRGDLVTIEPEPYYGIQGHYPVLAFHHRGDQPFARRPLNWRENFRSPSGVFALDTSRILVQHDDDGSCAGCPIASIVDGEGVLRGVLDGPPDTIGAGIVVDRIGRIRALRMMSNSGEYRLLTYGADGGPLLSNIPVPIATDSIHAMDLASDQCTLYYDFYNRISRVDICTGAVLPDLARDLQQSTRDLRILPNGDILVLFGSRMVRFKPNGAIVRQYDAVVGAAIALDHDPEYIWIGVEELRRIHLASGEIVERIPAYNNLPVGRISVIGEPRAARKPTRRHAVRR